VVIADFGLARTAINARQVFSTQCGTPSYVAPEILLGGAPGCEQMRALSLGFGVWEPGFGV